MGSMNRAIRRRKELAEKKAARKALKKIESAIGEMPSTCSSCVRQVNKSDIQANLDWYVEIDDVENMRLTCPDCHSKETEDDSDN